jgi:hypothetical protein
MSLMPSYFTTVRSGSKKSKNPANAKAQAEHEAWLVSKGINTKPKRKQREKLQIDPINRDTSNDSIPANGSKKKNNQYTGNELMGVATMHKSNAVPVRKDNKQASIDISNMRRN